MSQVELVVLVDDAGEPIGTADKALIHGPQTPLHLAFSCYLMNPAGQLLLTRRALGKLTWPGVWTNSFCGHPGPDETPVQAIHRRAQEELGARVQDVRVVLPEFRYRAIDASGVVENEICPVHVATVASELEPNPAEIAEWTWVEPAAVALALDKVPVVFSPWMREQLPQLMDKNLL